MELDKDIRSTQEVRDLVKKAKEAQLEFKHYNQSQVDKIIKAMADAGFAQSERLAKMAHEETGFGKVEDKITKNQFGSRDVYNSIKDLKTVGVIDIKEGGKVVKIAEPMGVVAALIPSTNPTSTAFFKALISLKTRNSIVVSPHPKAVACTSEALQIMTDAAISAGAPKDLIQCMTTPTLEGTEALMKHNDIAIILATGSTPMVKAAYSAGTPAYGVGSGNVPSFIERSANYEKAVLDIIFGTTFDNGTLCSSEQAMIVDRPIVEKVRKFAQASGCYFTSVEEKRKLEKAVINKGRINAEIVGKSANFIAKYAGFSVPESTKVLISECKSVGEEEPLSAEKLSPILAFYAVDGWLEGCHKCIDLLNFGGIGHTMSIHSNDQEIIMKFALEKPAFRIIVNSPASMGAVGYTTALDPSMTLGVGTWGGSIISENVTAKHLMHVKTLAFEVKQLNKGSSVNSLGSSQVGASFSAEGSFIQQIEDRLRARAGNPIHSRENEVGNLNKPEKKSHKLGSGISESEVQKIIREFNS
ncbi:MAG: aldehyde dehydrogenase family protein [Melioribacteraceae bacterium]|nr:aldehyde dehydrogenase family protein [Melioribacteraceae bacterium]